MKKFFVVIFMFLLSIPAAYGLEDKQADDLVKSFLEAVNIVSLPEGKKFLQQYTWDTGEMEYPEILDYKKVYGSIFETDAPGIVGYRQILNMKLVGVRGAEIHKKYIVLCYKDKASDSWKIYEFREGMLDADNGSVMAEQKLNDTSYNGKIQYNYRRYGYWLMMAGKPAKAGEAFRHALKVNEVDPFDAQIKYVRYVNITNGVLGLK